MLAPCTRSLTMCRYYAATIYENSIGLSPLMSRILAACNGTEYFIASCIPIFLVERLGRRPLLLVGSVGMALSFVVLTVTTNRLLAATNAGQNNTGASITAATFFFIFNTFFAVGWLGLVSQSRAWAQATPPHEVVGVVICNVWIPC